MTEAATPITRISISPPSSVRFPRQVGKDRGEADVSALLALNLVEDQSLVAVVFN